MWYTSSVGLISLLHNETQFLFSHLHVEILISSIIESFYINKRKLVHSNKRKNDLEVKNVSHGADLSPLGLSTTVFLSIKHLSNSE